MRRITLECAWVKLETPATHEKYRARQRRITEAGDSVPGSQRRVLDLQLSDSPGNADRSSSPNSTAYAPLSKTYPDRARQQQQKYLRRTQCGPDRAAFRGATGDGLMLHMVQKHGG